MAIAAPPEYLSGKRELISYSDSEAVYGTALAPKELLGREARWTPNNSKNWKDVKGAGTDSIEVTVQELPYETWGGTLTYVPQDWKLLKFLLTDGTADSVSDTTGNGAPYTHTFQMDKTLGSFTVQRAIQHTTDHVTTYEGCQINRWTLNWDATGGEGFCTASAEIMAENCAESSTTTSLSAATTEGFKPRMVTATWDDGAVTEVLRGSLSIENNLTDGRYCSYSATSPYVKKASQPTIRRFVGEMTVLAKDNTYWADYDVATEMSGAMSIALTRGSSDSFTVTGNNIYVTALNDPTNLDGYNEVTLRWSGGLSSVVAVDAQSDYNAFG